MALVTRTGLLEDEAQLSLLSLSISLFIVGT